MPQTTDALIIREYNNIGEADRFVAALTRDLGLIRASARGARNIKSRNAAATQLLAYSRLSLVKGRDKYIIDSAAPLNVFTLEDARETAAVLAGQPCTEKTTTGHWNRPVT